MRNLLFYYLFLCSVVHADPARQDIAQIKKQKEALSLERQKCLKEADTLEKMINALSVEMGVEILLINQLIINVNVKRNIVKC